MSGDDKWDEWDEDDEHYEFRKEILARIDEHEKQLAELGWDEFRARCFTGDGALKMCALFDSFSPEDKELAEKVLDRAEKSGVTSPPDQIALIETIFGKLQDAQE